MFWGTPWQLVQMIVLDVVRRLRGRQK